MPWNRLYSAVAESYRADARTVLDAALQLTCEIEVNAPKHELAGDK